MKVQRVVTNETCNQSCWFCNARRPAERPDFAGAGAVRERIRAALAGETRELVLTGGEPALRPDIAELVRAAAAGRGRAVLETNATLIDAARARELAAAGLHTARVQLTAWGDAADEITRDPGGFAAALAGIHALAAAGVRVEITSPVVRRNLVHLPRLVREIARLPIAELVLVVPLSAPLAGECAASSEVASAVTAVADEARRVGLAVRLDAASFVPPCTFEKVERVAHLFALNRGGAQRHGYTHRAPCASCLVNDRCPGFPDALPTESARPVTDPRIRRRLTVISSVEEQIERELVSRQIVRGAYGAVPEHTVRINFHCNQACEFCFVSTHLPAARETAVRAAIAAAGDERAILVISGGEPTLNPRLVDYIALARRHGVRAIELQTNAIRLADRALTRAVVGAGVDQVTVSLHAAKAELSDAITAAPGTFALTVRGLDELAATAVRLRLNFVFCKQNCEEFPAFVDLVAERWPRAGITPIFVGSHTDLVPRTTELIPTFAEILPPLRRGLQRARAAGLEIGGFETMCGLPLCLVPESERAAFSEIALAADAGGGEFVKAEACSRCSESHRCYGVRRGYAELYGTGELQPFGREAADISP